MKPIAEFGVDEIDGSDLVIVDNRESVVTVNDVLSVNEDEIDICSYLESMLDIIDFRCILFDRFRNWFRLLRKYKKPPPLINKRITIKRIAKNLYKII